MTEAVTRGKGLLSLASEMGFGEVSNVVHLGTDSSAAKIFVSRRGMGKMRHVEIKDLWFQKEVREGKVLVHKVVGTEDPADFVTKILVKDGRRRKQLLEEEELPEEESWSKIVWAWVAEEKTEDGLCPMELE